MKYIDIHAHAYRKPNPFVTRFCTPEELLERYDRYGIEAGMVLPVVNSEIYLPQSIEDVLDMAEKYPKRIYPFCNIDPRALINRSDARLDEVMVYYRDLGCLGIGEVMPNMSMDDDRVQNLFACAEKVGMPITTDGSDRTTGDFGLYDEVGLPFLEHTLCRFPKLKFIAHGPIFWAEYSTDVRKASRKPVFASDGLQYGSKPPKSDKLEEGVAWQLLRAFPHLIGELSDAMWQLKRNEDFAVKFLCEFQDQLMFGTDCCNSTVDANFRGKLFMDQLHDSGKLPTDVWKKICRNNAIDYFKLDLEKA